MVVTQPHAPQEIDPRDLTKDELIQALLEMQSFAQQLEAGQQDYQSALSHQSVAIAQLQAALDHSTGRLNNLAAVLVDIDALTERLVRSYADFTLTAGKDHSSMLIQIRPLLRLIASVVGHHLLKIVVGSEGDLTVGS